MNIKNIIKKVLFQQKSDFPTLKPFHRILPTNDLNTAMEIIKKDEDVTDVRPLVLDDVKNVICKRTGAMESISLFPRIYMVHINDLKDKNIATCVDGILKQGRSIKVYLGIYGFILENLKALLSDDKMDDAIRIVVANTYDHLAVCQRNEFEAEVEKVFQEFLEFQKWNQQHDVGK